MLSFKHWLNEAKLNEIKKKGGDEPAPEDDFDGEDLDMDDMDLDDNPDVVFSRRDENEKIEAKTILSALGLPGNKLVYHDKGSFAIVYKHPTNANLLIKLTADDNDAANLQEAQSLKSRNIVKVYKAAKIRDHATALIVDFVKGPPMVYRSVGLLSLINGDRWEDVTQAAQTILKPDRTRVQILDHFNKNTPQELKKLSELFTTLAQLEDMGIEINDFGDNIHDAGDHYVMIDLGL